MSPAGAETFDLARSLAESGLVSRITLGLLAVMSVAGWALWGSRHLALGRLLRRCRQGRDEFLRAGADPAAFETLARELPEGPVPRLFASARAEQRAFAEPADWSPARAEAARSLLMRTLASRGAEGIAAARRGLPLLASIGATAPFVGLFGTVWGVIDAFGAIGTLRSADLAVVAPGIAEALIATAAGLVAAIPAVWAYNALGQRLRNVAIELERFSAEVMNAFDRGVAAPRG